VLSGGIASSADLVNLFFGNKNVTPKRPTRHDVRRERKRR
jgi:hypothetical protein